MGSNIVEDVGECWRAVNPRNITPTKTLKWVDGQSNDTGIRYTMGVDPLTGQTGIAYVDYPKQVWTYDDVLNSDVVDKFFARCQICAAVDQIKEVRSTPSVPVRVGSSDLTGRSIGQSMPPGEQQYHRQFQRPVERVSVGDSIAQLPQYVPVAIKLVKSLLLSRLGDAASSVVLSFAADAASGLSPDPQYRSAMQSLSDTFVEDINIDERFVEEVRGDVTRLADAYSRDGNLLSAVKTSMVKSHAEMVSPLDRYSTPAFSARKHPGSFAYTPKLASERFTPSRAID